MDPILQATTDGDEAWDDPSEDLLHDLMVDIREGRAEFLIVTRTEDPSGQTYVQTTLAPDGGWIVEHREGSSDQHFGATAADLETAHRVVAGWSYSVPGWEQALPSAKVTF